MVPLYLEEALCLVCGGCEKELIFNLKGAHHLSLMPTLLYYAIHTQNIQVLLRPDDCGKALPQSGHTYGLIPVWRREWISSNDLLLVIKLQSWQVKFSVRGILRFLQRTEPDVVRKHSCTPATKQLHK
jgi:hypothetical protein